MAIVVLATRNQGNETQAATPIKITHTIQAGRYRENKIAETTGENINNSQPRLAPAQ